MQIYSHELLSLSDYRDLLDLWYCHDSDKLQVMSHSEINKNSQQLNIIDQLDWHLEEESYGLTTKM